MKWDLYQSSLATCFLEIRHTQILHIVEYTYNCCFKISFCLFSRIGCGCFIYVQKFIQNTMSDAIMCQWYHVYVKMSVYVIDYSIDVQYVFWGLRGQWNYFCATFYTLFNKPFTACTYFLLHFVYSYIICHILLTAFVNSIGLMLFTECTNIVLLQHIL